MGLKYKLSEIIDLIGGGTPKTSVAEYWGGDIPWLSVKDFKDDSRYVYSTEKTITKAGLENSTTKLLKVDDIIISARGTVGELAMVPYPMAFNQSCYGIRGKKGKVVQTYLYYLLKDSIRVLKSQTHGSVFDTITRDTFHNINVDLPSLTVQHRIADTLSALDARIAVNREINNHLEQMAQAIFKSWFVDFEPFQGVMPDDWREGTLSEISYITMGQSPAGSSYNEESSGTVFYQGRAEFGFRFPSRRLFTTQSKRMATKGDVLMSVRAPVGDLNVAIEMCSLGRGLAGIKSNNRCQSFVLYTMFALKETLDMFNGEGTVFGSINKKDLENLTVIIPAKEVLLKFEELVNPIDTIIETNYMNSCVLQAVRDSLLPRLMSGELSVTDMGAK